MKQLILILGLLFVLSGCANSEPKTLTEKNAPKNMENSQQKQIIDEINKLKNQDQKQNREQKKKQVNKNKEKKMQIENLSKEYKYALIKTNLGDIKVKFYDEDSPNTVNNFLTLAKNHFYDNTKFHRVIKDFMIQGGDPNSKDDSKKNLWGTGGPGYRFEDEINAHKLVRGSLAMANSGPNTNGSQFFIVTAKETPWLDGRHTNFGEVVEGMDVVDKIENVKTEGPDRPVEDVVIKTIELLKE